MSIVKIELDLDWLDEDESVDDFIKKGVLENLESRLVANAEKQITNKLNEILEGIARKVSDDFIQKTLEAKIEELQIPYKENVYGSKFDLIPISEFIGMRYEKFLNEKTMDYEGNTPRHNSDRKISISEYFIKNYLEKELSGKVSKMIQTARQEAEEMLIKSLEGNLKAQLSAEMINKLNIPQLLKSLQCKAVELENK